MKLTTKVVIELMDMVSAPGYRPSYGYRKAILVDIEEATACGRDTDRLFAVDGKEITVDDLSDVVTEDKSDSVGTLLKHKGTYDIPEGHAVVQLHYENVCTAPRVYKAAWVIAIPWLGKHYLWLGQNYNSLARDQKLKNGWA